MTFTGYGVKYGISYKTEIINEMKVNIYAPASPKTYIFYSPSSLYSNSYFYEILIDNLILRKIWSDCFYPKIFFLSIHELY